MVLEECIENQGMDVQTASCLEEMEEILGKGATDCCVVEAVFDQNKGYTLLKNMRTANQQEPVIFLTDSTARPEMIRAYELGADDVVSKPFSFDLLVCKIRALVRRYRDQYASSETVFDLGGKPYDSVRQTIGDQRLSGRENELLLMLCREMNNTVDKHRILRQLWQKDDFFSSRSLAVYMNHLRGYLEGTGCQIVSVHGKGYKLINN